MSEKKLFDYVIGNPPYQEDSVGGNDKYSPQVYNKFLDASFQVAQKVELVHPARFLFNAGSTPKEWNEKMLNDPNLKILKYVSDSQKMFPSIQLTGGVAVSYHDEERTFGAIRVFTPFQELNSILHKVIDENNFTSMESIVITRTIYRFTEKMHLEHPEARYHEDKNGNNIGCLSNGHDYDVSSNIFDAIPQIFYDDVPDRNHEYIKMLGRKNGNRAYMFVRKDFIDIDRVPNFDKYKIVLARADGAAGTIGKPIPARIIGTPVVEAPGVGTTESFLSIGECSNEKEANNLLKYVKTKFMRALLSILKITQDINPGKWKYVPIQDFTTSSDIDWSKSVHEIDLQLYRKYGLNEDEINFIETHVKEMA
jgi:hypothetical protein